VFGCRMETADRGSGPQRGRIASGARRPPSASSHRQSDGARQQAIIGRDRRGASARWRVDRRAVAIARCDRARAGWRCVPIAGKARSKRQEFAVAPCVSTTRAARERADAGSTHTEPLPLAELAPGAVSKHGVRGDRFVGDRLAPCVTVLRPVRARSARQLSSTIARGRGLPRRTPRFRTMSSQHAAIGAPCVRDHRRESRHHGFGGEGRRRRRTSSLRYSPTRRLVAAEAGYNNEIGCR